MVAIDEKQCGALADYLAKETVPREEEEVETSDLPPGIQSNYYLAVVAICHQTQTLYGEINGAFRRGWDYLSQRLYGATQLDPALMSPKRWLGMTGNDLIALLHCPKNGTTIADPHGRSSLLNDLGKVMLHDRVSSFEELYTASERRACTGSANIMARLSTFAAYSDPVRKKSAFLLGLMSNSAGWHYVDEDEIPPPVDYHEIRGHLRLGTVRITSQTLKRKVQLGLEVDATEDIAIRSAVTEAIKTISRLTSASPMRLHYMFWNIFRTVCRRDVPACTSTPQSCFPPKRYEHLMHVTDSAVNCPFLCQCDGVRLGCFPREHVFRTDWY